MIEFVNANGFIVAGWKTSGIVTGVSGLPLAMKTNGEAPVNVFGFGGGFVGLEYPSPRFAGMTWEIDGPVPEVTFAGGGSLPLSSGIIVPV